MLWLAYMMSTAAGKVEKFKNSRDVTTHRGLAEQSYGNIMHGGILLLVFLLLACSVPRVIELLIDWLKHSPRVPLARMTLSEVMNEDARPLIPATQCRDPDAVQWIRDAAAAKSERRLMEPNSQRALLAAAVKDYRMAREAWHQKRLDEVLYCQTGLHDATVCIRLRPAVHELLGRLCIRQDSPPATPSSMPAPFTEF